MGWNEVGRSVERDTTRALLLIAGGVVFVAGVAGAVGAQAVDVLLHRHQQ